MYREIHDTRSWYSVSLPHHFPSSFSGAPSANALNEQLLADLIDAAVREIPAGKLHFVGYSLGGFAAMNYAAKFPERVASVISVGGFLTGRAQGIEGVLQFFARGTFFRRAVFHGGYWLMQRHRIFFKLATLAYARQWRRLLGYHALDPTIRNIFPDVRNHRIEGQRAWFRYLLDMDLLDETENIACPVLVIAGDRDPVIPFRHQERYATLLPDATLVVLPGVGHVAFGEAPEQFKQTLLEWLRNFDAPVVSQRSRS